MLMRAAPRHTTRRHRVTSRSITSQTFSVRRGAGRSRRLMNHLFRGVCLCLCVCPRQLGLVRGTRSFMAQVRAVLARDSEPLRMSTLASLGVAHSEALLDLNLQLFVRNDDTFRTQYLRVVDEQRRRAIACGVQSAD